MTSPLNNAVLFPRLACATQVVCRRCFPVILFVAACEPETPPLPTGGPPEVRDCAGIRIVYRPAPAFADEDFWQLGHRPAIQVRGTDGSEDNRLLDPASVYRAADGRLVVADGMFAGWHQVLVFNSRGRYVDSFGRKGPGPCEFRQLWWAQPYRGDSIVAYDYADHVAAIFGPDGKCGREVRLPNWRPETPQGTRGYSKGADGVFEDGSFLAYPNGAVDVDPGPGTRWYRHELIRVSADGSAWDSLGQFEITQVRWTGSEQKTLPFGAYALTVVGPRSFYFGTAEDFEVRNFDMSGRVTQIVRWAGTRAPVTPADVEEYKKWYTAKIRTSSEAPPPNWLEREFRELEPPRVKPAYSWLLVDVLGNLWVEKYRWTSPFDRRPESHPITWEVFGNDGHWLGHVEVPHGVLLRSVGDDEAIGFFQDELDVRHLYVYDLIKR